MGKKITIFMILLNMLIILFLVAVIVFGRMSESDQMIGKPFIKTSASTLVKEILPTSEYVCLVYNYQSTAHREVNTNWLSSRKILIVYDGSIKLGFNCSNIKVVESDRQMLLYMPPIEILSHEQYIERAKSYDLARESLFLSSFKPQELLDLLGDTKFEQQKLVEENDDLMKQARESAEKLFRPLLELNPVIKGRYEIIFVW